MKHPSRQALSLRHALFEPIGEHGRAELVERRLHNAITGGHLRPGERLPSEQDLAHTFRVSTVTVREALRGMRERKLISTKRGRGGGSFVADSGDPLDPVRAHLASTSRLALRDLGLHYAAIAVACVRLAVRRATDDEISHALARLDNMAVDDPIRFRQVFDDVTIEVISLSQSARLTREHMGLQVEFSPFVRLLDPVPAARASHVRRVREIVQAIADGDDERAAAATETAVAKLVTELLTLKGTADTAPIPTLTT